MRTADPLPPTARRSSPAEPELISHVWLTPEEAVAYLALPSRMALYQAVRRGQVSPHRFGRRLRFLRAELDAALEPR